MSPRGMAYPSSLTLLSCASSSQLADFCALIVPCIWAGQFKQPLLTAKLTTFKLFCQKILKQTQISCACVLLALYYIYRLRSAYPSIQASNGSEIRLFTTGLILANKFLDDNTFTNKTWSDVSNIPVRELNIMEMEFLSALNYSIYISHHQFFAWATQCQQWLPLITRPIKMPVRPSTKTYMSSSASMPALMPTTARKRTAYEEPLTQHYQQAPKRRYSPFDPYMSTQTTVPDLRSYSNTPFTNTAAICKPILSWSSSTSALQSSRLHPVIVPSPAASVATAAAAAAVVNANYLAARVKCLEIE